MMKNRLALCNTLAVIEIVGKNQIFGLILRVVTSLCGVLLPLLFALAERQFIAKITDKTASFKAIFIAAAAIAGVKLFQNLLFLVFNLINGRASESLTHKLRKALLEKCGKLQLCAYDDPSLFDKLKVAERISSESISNILSGLFGLLTAANQLVVTGIILCRCSALLLICAVVSALLGVFFWKRTVNYEEFDKRRTNLVRRMGYFKDISTDGAYTKEVKLFGILGFTLGRFGRYNEEWNNAEMEYSLKTSKLRLMLNPVSYLFSFIIPALFFIRLASISNMTVANFSYYLSIVAMCCEAISKILNLHFNRLVNEVRIQDYLDFINLPLVERNGKSVPKSWLEKAPNIRFENVSFCYDGADRNAVDSVDLEIKSGEKIAIIGKNGAGKTTLIKLLTGLYSPSSGRITIDDREDFDFSQETIYKMFSVVFQDFQNYDLTVRESLSLGSHNVYTDDELFKAAEGIAGDILDKRFNHDLSLYMGVRISESGINLSGGEKQKIALARAVIQDRPIAILDEPTANLDAYAEAAILEKFLQNNAGKTTLIISHRLSCTALCDRVIILENGRIVEQGTHDELLEYGGEYARMYKKQAESF